MNPKIGLFFAFFYLAFASGTPERTFAQGSQQPFDCRPSARTILSEIAALYRLSPDRDKILVAGQVTHPQLISPKERVTLTEALALAKDVTPLAGRLVYFLRRSTDSEFEIEMVADLREIRKGRHPDPLLKKGDVLSVSEPCSEEENKRPRSKSKRRELVDSPVVIPKLPRPIKKLSDIR